MFEYYVLYATKDPEHLIVVLNGYARDGWRVIGVNNSVIVLEREKQPTIESKETEKSKLITYSWDF
jgi:uncharacterized protein YjhX (UPF0386 family)